MTRQIDTGGVIPPRTSSHHYSRAPAHAGPSTTPVFDDFLSSLSDAIGHEAGSSKEPEAIPNCDFSSTLRGAPDMPTSIFEIVSRKRPVISPDEKISVKSPSDDAVAPSGAVTPSGQSDIWSLGAIFAAHPVHAIPAGDQPKPELQAEPKTFDATIAPAGQDSPPQTSPDLPDAGATHAMPGAVRPAARSDEQTFSLPDPIDANALTRPAETVAITVSEERHLPPIDTALIARQIADAIPDTGTPPAPASPPVALQTPQPTHLLKLQLEPANLGLIDLRIHLSGDTLRLYIGAGDRDTLAAIDSDRQTLVDALKSAGYAVDALTIQSVGPLGPLDQTNRFSQSPEQNHGQGFVRSGADGDAQRGRHRKTQTLDEERTGDGYLARGTYI